MQISTVPLRGRRVLLFAALAFVLPFVPARRASACDCAVGSDPAHIPAPRFYDMAPIIEDCKETPSEHCMVAAVTAVFTHDPDDAVNQALTSYSVGVAAAKTLYFAPGGDYVIDAPLEIANDGIVFRGEAASPFAPSSGQEPGTTFFCATTDDTQGCIHVEGDGFVFDGIRMQWDASVADRSTVRGIWINGANGTTIRNAYWNDFPGYGVQLSDDAQFTVLENLRFDNPNSYSSRAIHTTSSAGQDLDGAAPHHLTIRDVHVEGYWYGVYLRGTVGATNENCDFVDQTSYSIYTYGALQTRIRGCRFSAAETSGVAAAIRMYEPSYDTHHRFDTLIEDCVFDMGCITGREPIDLYASASYSALPRPRVLLSGNTFLNCRPLAYTSGATTVYTPFPSADFANTEWQCVANRVVTSTSCVVTTNPPSVDCDYATYTFGRDECDGDPAGSSWPTSSYNCVTP